VRALAEPVTLAAIKGDKRFADFALVRQSRLSVMEVPGPLAAAILGMAGG
ncbi:MAG: EVE domain-containing protein, partial [Planctomycetes bacterium]|nr:EVE domain-containing protein [Planctomycetota bacterium]